MSRGVRKQIEGHDVKNPFGLSGATTSILLAECEEEFLGFKRKHMLRNVSVFVHIMLMGNWELLFFVVE